jgi:hypothetical protein
VAKAGNPGGGKHWKTADFKNVIMNDNKYVGAMGQSMDKESRSKGASVTDYSKTKE